ncbi:MAG TPA: 4'-phosphopantetheinyl transferase superfamily protein [Pyrinomonadaceae bacterium]|nr:4'-phosphopantetheinyl transferase superfamily protein [Pyrinomonadaceae bacterium]
MLLANVIPRFPASLKPLRFPGVDLPEDEVHLWQANLDSHDASIFESFLSADEIARANRFHFSSDRKHYVVCRGLLRNLLAAYLSVDGRKLQFCYGAQGKPFVIQQDERQINFNVSHSHGRAAFAFAVNKELGVDIEFVKSDFEVDEIAQHFFSRNEVASLRVVPAHLRKHCFFNCWTRKEAYIKARGEGLSMPLNEFDVSLRPDEPVALLNNYREERELSRWSMRSIPAPEGYVGAVVVTGNDWTLKSFSFENSQRAKTLRTRGQVQAQASVA